MRHEAARTIVCHGYFVNKPAVPSAGSIGTSVTGNGRVGSCRDNVPPPLGGSARRPRGGLGTGKTPIVNIAGFEHRTRLLFPVRWRHSLLDSILAIPQNLGVVANDSEWLLLVVLFS